MKLKKIVAAVCAAAMTVSAVAITPLLASAEDVELQVGSVSSVTLENNPWAGDENAIANPQVILDSKWGNAVSVNGYSGLEISYTCDNPEVISDIYLVAQNGTMPGNWYQTTAKPAATGSLVLDFTEQQDKTYEQLLIQIQPVSGYEIGDTFEPGFTVTSAKLVSIPEESEEPAPEEPSDSIVLWEGSKDLGTDWGSNVRTSVAADKVKAGDTIKITYEAGTAAEYQQIKLMQGADGWPVLTSVKVSEWGTVDLDAASTEFTFVINADDAAAIIANNIIISGYNVTIKSIEVIPAASEPETPSDPVTPTAPSANPLAGNCTVMPAVGGAINLTASDNAAAIAKLKDGASYEYELSDMNPVIKRRVFQSIMGRDITLKVTYKGMTWEFNGKEITEPHTVNFKTLYEKAMAE